MPRTLSVPSAVLALRERRAARNAQIASQNGGQKPRWTDAMKRRPLTAGSLICLGLMAPLIATAIEVQNYAKDHASAPQASTSNAYVSSVKPVAANQVSEPALPLPPLSTATGKQACLTISHPHIVHHQSRRVLASNWSRARPAGARWYPASAEPTPVYVSYYDEPYPVAPWVGYGPAYYYGGYYHGRLCCHYAGRFGHGHYFRR